MLDRLAQICKCYLPRVPANRLTSWFCPTIVELLGPRRKRILDIGCGSGQLAYHLASLGYSVTAIDSDPGAISSAISAHHQHDLVPTFVVAGAEDALSLYKQVDAVVFAFSLHHMDVEKTLALAKSSVRPGGCILVIDLDAQWTDTYFQFCLDQLVWSHIRAARTTWHFINRHGIHTFLRYIAGRFRYYVDSDSRHHVVTDLANKRMLTEFQWITHFSNVTPHGLRAAGLGAIFLFYWEA